LLIVHRPPLDAKLKSHGSYDLSCRPQVTPLRDNQIL
jgi:hypothetical protein